MMKAICLKCFREYVAYDEFDGEYIFGDEDRGKVSQWIESCKGKIILYFPDKVTELK